MNLLALDQGTMAGMSDDHFIASVEPLLMTPLEKELFKRFVQHESNELMDVVRDAGFDDADALKACINREDPPDEGVLASLIDDALYLAGMFAEGSEGKEVAEKLHKALIELYETM